MSPSEPDFYGALEVVARHCELHGAAAFKVGRGLQGLSRPDKCVIYYPTHAAALSAAADLAWRLQECEGQGVPFTQNVGPTLVVSVGQDPPEEEFWSSMAPRSWRSWVTHRLAASLITADESNSPLTAWEFALIRIRLDGVNPESWSPDSASWD